MFKVLVNGQNGQVWGIAPGKVVVQMDNGNLVEADLDEVQPVEEVMV